jgi:hypothetical protein
MLCKDRQAKECGHVEGEVRVMLPQVPEAIRIWKRQGKMALATS